MNKQELIETIKREINDWKEKEELGVFEKSSEVGVANRIFGLRFALNAIKQLDEPQKIKVPHFVGEWYENAKNDLEQKILDYVATDFEDDYSNFGEWMDNPTNKPFETLIRMQEGYEVNPHLFHCQLGKTPGGSRYVLQRGEQTIIIAKKKKATPILPKIEFLTEKEIRSVDDRFMSFARPVEPVEVAE